MKPQQTTADTLDLLALLDAEEAVFENTVQAIQDPLGQIETSSAESIEILDFPIPARESALTRFRRASLPKVQFLFYYLGISAIVFVILIASTNWNSYSTVLSAYLNPQGLVNSRNDIISVLDKSRVMVYADNSIDTGATVEEQTNLKKKLEESNTSVREDRFSPKRLIPGEAKINIDPISLHTITVSLYQKSERTSLS